jgi:hypothetical protein
MAILDAELLAEIQSDIDAGLGARLIAQRLNLPGGALVSSWVVADGDRPVDKELFLQALTIDDAANIQTLMDSGSRDGQALKFKLGRSDTIDMSKKTNRDFVANLELAGAIAADTKGALLRLGEIEASRAQELWGEPVTIEQVRSVMGAV